MHFSLGWEEIVVKRGLFVGRFQPFHKGHLKPLKDILEKLDELVIVVGSSQYSHKIDNPFTAGERITMIRRALEEEGIAPSRYWIISVPDVHVHMTWVSHLVGYTPKFTVVYSNAPLTRRLFVEAGYKVEPVPFHKREVYSATEIRKRMLNGQNWEQLVPNSVVQFIKEISGVERIRDLAKSDI
jgi:nicotinamide-nucleotide adenylyltransferase